MTLSSPSPSLVPKYDPWTTRPKFSTAPPGLRNLPPVQAAPKPRSGSQQAGPPQTANEARKKPCGTETAARRHVRNGEPVCAVCQAGRDARNGTKHRPSLAECGSPGGRDRHMREGTPVCPLCRATRNRSAKQRKEKTA